MAKLYSLTNTDSARICLGPNLAPGLLQVAASSGTPTKQASKSEIKIGLFILNQQPVNRVCEIILRFYLSMSGEMLVRPSVRSSTERAPEPEQNRSIWPIMGLFEPYFGNFGPILALLGPFLLWALIGLLWAYLCPT